MNASAFRYVKLYPSGEKVLFDSLKVGDLFTLYEPDGTPVNDGKVMRAEENAKGGTLNVTFMDPDPDPDIDPDKEPT